MTLRALRAMFVFYRLLNRLQLLPYRGLRFDYRIDRQGEN